MYSCGSKEKAISEMCIRDRDGYAPGESIAFDFENGNGTYTYQGLSLIHISVEKSNFDFTTLERSERIEKEYKMLHIYSCINSNSG